MNQTTTTYQSVEGAQKYFEKELKTAVGRNQEVARVMDLVDWQGKVALDIGCGFGRDVGAMRQRGALAYGVDVSPPLLAMATTKIGPYFAEADVFTMQSLPFGLNGLDIIWSCAALVHVPAEQLPTLLQRWDSWLKPGGVIVILTKRGMGAETYTNLGNHLPRTMYFHQPESMMQVLPHYQVLQSLAWQPTEVADEFMALILQK
jgi:SAM-dependent methyltransferase